MNLSSLTKRLFLFVLSYLLLNGLASIPAVHQKLNSFYIGGAKIVSTLCLDDAYTQWLSEGKSGEQIRLVFGNQVEVEKQITQAKKQGKQEADLNLKEFFLKSKEFFTIPLRFFLALVLVSPLSSLAKLKSVGLGFSLIFFVLLLKLLCYVLYQISISKIGVYEFEGIGFSLLKNIYENLNIGSRMVFATLTWLMCLVLFGKGKNPLQP